MPYSLKKLPNGKIALIKKTTGKTVGESSSTDMARKAIEARLSNEKNSKGGNNGGSY